MSGQESYAFKKLFIISPIGSENSPTREYFDKVRRHIIDPVAKDMAYLTVRSDEIPRPGTITNHIIEHLLKDDLVVADMTERNPNVFYELAVRHAVRKPVILMGAIGNRVPFDLAAQRVIFYDLDPDNISKAKEELRRQISEVNSEKFIVDSPIETAISFESTGQVTEESQLKEVLSILRTQSKKLTRIEETIFKPSTGNMVSPQKIHAGVAPSNGPVGTEAFIFTTNHTSGSIVEVFFDFVKPQNILSATVAGPDGKCMCEIVIPQAEKGLHYIWIRDEATGRTENLPFEVL